MKSRSFRKHNILVFFSLSRFACLLLSHFSLHAIHLSTYKQKELLVATFYMNQKR